MLVFVMVASGICIFGTLGLLGLIASSVWRSQP